MNTIEIKVTTNGLETGQAAALANFLTSLNVDTTSEATEPKRDNCVAWDELTEMSRTGVEKPEPVKQTRTRAIKEKPAPVVEVEVIEHETVEPEPTEEGPQDEPQPEPDTTAAMPTLMQIRAVVSEKAQKSDELKTALRDKLKSFGVTNVSTLAEENWSEFYEFATAL